MIKRVFGTFKKFVNNSDGTRRIVFNNLINDLGEEIKGEVYIDNPMVISMMKLRFGHRYMIKYGKKDNGVLSEICQTKKVYKNPRCDFFRRFKDEYHIVGGKYKGMKHHQIEKSELVKYCIWLGSNTDNEMTIKNVLSILEKISK